MRGQVAKLVTDLAKLDVEEFERRVESTLASGLAGPECMHELQAATHRLRSRMALVNDHLTRGFACWTLALITRSMVVVALTILVDRVLIY